MGNNNNDYSDAIAIVILAFLIVAMYLFDEYISDYLFYIWYWLKMPLYTGLNYIPESIRDVLFSYGNITGLIGDSLNKLNVNTNLSDFNLNLSKDISLIAKEFQSYTFEELFNRKNREGLVSLVNKNTPFILLPVTLPILIYFCKKIINKKNYKKTFTIETLGIQEAKIWPQIKPVVHEYNDFVNANSLDEGWFAMSPKPAQYFKNNDLLTYEKNIDESDIENYGTTNFRIRPDKMHAFFVKELGKPWTGVLNMSFEKRAVLAIIIPKLLRQKIKLTAKSKPIDKSKYMNDRLAEAYSSIRNIKVKGKMIKDKEHEKQILEYREKIKLEVDEQLREYFPEEYDVKKENFIFRLIPKFLKKRKHRKETPDKIKEILDSHFHEKVIFSIFLEKARNTGVLASCEFIWLKKENRDLWYIMSQTGRTACFCESAGAWAHLLTEKKVGRKISTPMVQRSIDAADKYLFETHENYIPMGDFSDE
jgi:hypothetical protein